MRFIELVENSNNDLRIYSDSMLSVFAEHYSCQWRKEPLLPLLLLLKTKKIVFYFSSVCRSLIPSDDS